MRLQTARPSTDEARCVAARVCLAELFLVERTDAQKQRELVPQVRAHHLRAVGGDREGDAVLDEGAECLAHGLLVGERLRQQVRRGADLEHDSGVAERLHQLGVGGGEDAVTDPVGPQVLDHLADLLPPGVAALLPTWIVTPRPASRAESTIGRTCV